MSDGNGQSGRRRPPQPGPSEAESSPAGPPQPEKLEPGLPLPGARRPLSSRGRALLAGGLAVSLVVAIAAGALLAGREGEGPRAVTLPPADRNASPALIAAAQAVDFRPPTLEGVGRVQDDPAETALPPSSKDLLPVGSEAAPFRLRTPTGDPVSLRDLRGKAVLLEFFAAWCPHCAAQAPHLRRLAERLPASKYAFVSVDGANEDAATVLAYHVWFGLPFPALLDPHETEEPVTFPDRGTRGPVSRSYGVGFFPTFYVIDPQGRITWRSDGEQPNALLLRELRKAAGEG
jgi:peroxiredoxin